MEVRILILVGFLLGGCVDVPTPVPAQETSTVTAANVLLFKGCREHATSIPVAAGNLAGYLPRGFRTAPYLGEASGRTAEVYAIFFDCPVEIDGQARDSRNFLLAANVVPPESHTNPRSDFYLLPITAYSTSPEVVGRLADMDIRAQQQEVEISLVLDTPTVGRGRASASGQDGSLVAETTVTGRQARPGPAGTVGMFSVSGSVIDRTPGDATGAMELWYSAGNVSPGPATIVATGQIKVLLGESPGSQYAGVAAHWWGSTYDIGIADNGTRFGPEIASATMAAGGRT